MGSKALVRSTDEARRMELDQALISQDMLAVRTAEAMRKLVLVDGKAGPKTELDDFPIGKVDPQLQLVLIARDHFLAAEDDAGKLGFYKAMRDVFLSVDQKTMAVLEVAMRDRHHREKMLALERKAGVDDWSDAEVNAIAKEEDK